MASRRKPLTSVVCPPPGADGMYSNFARYAFKGFRFAPIPFGDGFAALERTRYVTMP
jgi:hypothetical protein